MIVVMKQDSTKKDIECVAAYIDGRGYKPHISVGVERTIIGVEGRIVPELKDELELLRGVSEVLRVTKQYKLGSREFKPESTIVRVGNVAIGSDQVVVMAGPCAVESEEQVITTAKAIKAAGAMIMRGGAYKPRTSPYSFRGHGVTGLRMLAKAREETGLPIITEVMSTEEVETVAEYADILQIGARNIQNYPLLDRVGKVQRPVLLKRGFATTYEEWLLCAEYILAGGNPNVILCERGIRTFETGTRNTLDLTAIPVIKKLSHLPVIADPSHGTGKWYLVKPMALAAVAAGAHGLIIEVHPNPDTAWSDGAQSLTFENFNDLMKGVRAVAGALGRRMPDEVPAAQAVV
ncbi:MAG: 3-deoxy-7-phosphoheptulonate synthase [Candidatus Wildermuthbacteria bacterium RIFCSPHIGHO2_01_FULL_48_27b]|uniref:3-deoxy-7-phosphoheptulonate synthase n=1 Tax=Candidatus Wildermuthbacteria bacterium RIFCSPHIGHO2_01_FULL_48_27b TaxID=1802447 RepID=A0A1G2QTG3_9BACT|nr:MAG: 3-deoxy-7-phosphoheptulonate synthase [Candidatus Wildermuthbacteria bacterium RIFCSPHIGHO2_01_FULL_48_27b]